VPAGKYTLKVWHEKSKFTAIEVTVPDSGNATANVTAQ
jgi:hypothetical protein